MVDFDTGSKKNTEERRHQTRRIKTDRRVDIRFEPTKEDRRAQNRRKSDGDIWDHHET